ncbi:hypothetical protein SAMN05720761_102195 [Fibrobacter sp. UWCM]|uniref:hypothetical protein n=1 Tax=Fibrobacter sp. UWCM TaxID=1896208 RepID=UPI0009244545|nr:hypothetical protein [Fibrobacter sp. UWCM]SHG48881.1 hypothetical protein SAMN05720761_102195 [Fibrobacter sp. UWCM]
MNNKLTLGKIALGLLFASFYTACDESTTENITQVNQVGMDVVSAEKDLPECTAENEGAQAFVKGESSARVCVDEDWVPMTSSVKDTVVLSGDTVYLAGGKDTVYVKDSDLSCKTEPLADSSGLKIICNGDSIGVVLNGAKGDKGDTGEKGEKGDIGEKGDESRGCSIIDLTDSAYTLICGEVSLTVPLKGAEKPDTLSQDAVADFLGKGFFLKGSEVLLLELSDGKTLKTTGVVQMAEVTRDSGFYKFAARDLVSQYAKIRFRGFYRNPVSGHISDGQINLSGVTDMRKRSEVNMNVLTHLEYERTYYLVTRESETVKHAKRAAVREILNQFHIDTTGIDDAEDINIFGKSESGAKLLALTILLQGDRNEAEFVDLLTEISIDMAEDGVWDDSEKIKEIAEWARGVDKSGRLDKIRDNITKGDNTAIPDFIKYIRKFWQDEVG